jgi:YDG domain
LYAGDQLSVVNAVGSFENSAIGTHKEVTIHDIELNGASVSNYRLDSTVSVAYADILQNFVFNTAPGAKPMKDDISNILYANTKLRKAMVSPEMAYDAARSYDYRSVAYSMKFEYSNNRIYLVYYRGTGINLR